jgi:hypothetical protein
LGKDEQRSGEAAVDWCAEWSSLSELHAMPEGDLAELHRRDTDRLATRI